MPFFYKWRFPFYEEGPTKIHTLDVNVFAKVLICIIISKLSVLTQGIRKKFAISDRTDTHRSNEYACFRTFLSIFGDFRRSLSHAIKHCVKLFDKKLSRSKRAVRSARVPFPADS
jgi:hypothetical protein